MTGYAVDSDRNELIRTWATGRGLRAAAVGRLAGDAITQERLASQLSGLSETLWRCYTHPASAAGSTEEGTEGWRRQLTRDGFASVVSWIRNPDLPAEDGSVSEYYDTVEEYAHRIGRLLHSIDDTDLCEAVCADVTAELGAVESAELGDLSGRAVQAVALSRVDVSPAQVAAADAILKENPLAAERLLTELDPTAAAVATVHWLKAAADVAAKVSRLEPTQVLRTADDLQALRIETADEVLTLLPFSKSVRRLVVDMVSHAMNIADGVIAGLDDMPVRPEPPQGDYDDQEPEPIRLTPLDPRRPAPDMLEDLLTGIAACRLVYAEYSDTDEATVDAEFIAAVQKEAASNSDHLA